MDKINRIFLGDCLELMKDIPNGSIDMILCDLPYGTTACKWDSVINFDLLFKEYNRIIRKNGVIALTGIEPFTSQIINSNIQNFREKLVWVKHKPSNFGNAKVMHLKYFEDIVIFCNGKPTYNPQMQPRLSDRVKQVQKGNSKQWRTNRKENQEVSFATKYEPRSWHSFNADFKYPSNVINIPSVGSNSKEKVSHPTQKPVALFEYLIRTYTNENEIVLDNTAGSCTTAIACLNTNRNYICMEKEKEYYDIGVNRVKNWNEKQGLFNTENHG